MGLSFYLLCFISDFVSSSLIISYQLEDKLKVHEYLLNFLKNFDLFNKVRERFVFIFFRLIIITLIIINVVFLSDSQLSTSRIGDVLIPTNILLCEHAELLVAAKAIRLFLTE